jgi:hypothetical protein
VKRTAWWKQRVVSKREDKVGGEDTYQREAEGGEW